VELRRRVRHEPRQVALGVAAGDLVEVVEHEQHRPRRPGVVEGGRDVVERPQRGLGLVVDAQRPQQGARDAGGEAVRATVGGVQPVPGDVAVEPRRDVAEEGGLAVTGRREDDADAPRADGEEALAQQAGVLRRGELGRQVQPMPVHLTPPRAVIAHASSETRSLPTRASRPGSNRHPNVHCSGWMSPCGGAPGDLE
jgi:hypothetical protein